jgi:hypothetical protein
MARGEAGVGRIGIAQAARVAGVSRQAIYNWIGAGWLRPVAAVDGGGVDAADLARLCAMRDAAADLGVRPGTLRRIGRDVPPEAGFASAPGIGRKVVANGAKLAYSAPLVVAAVALNNTEGTESEAISTGED